MSEADLDRVCMIERELFGMPWSRASFLHEVSDNRIGSPIVALEEATVVGYAIAWFLEGELHIGNIAVAKARQGRGIGKLLLGFLLEEARSRGVGYATLEVRVSNVRAIGLYRARGFEGIAFRKGYYADNGEDALVMIADLRGSSTADAEM
jgi:ribosomal-protein-alanine N-acetyltransferase